MFLAKKTNFITCTVFGKQTENLEKYISQGALIGVEGILRVETWEKGGLISKLYFFCNDVQYL